MTTNQMLLTRFSGNVAGKSFFAVVDVCMKFFSPTRQKLGDTVDVSRKSNFSVLFYEDFTCKEKVVLLEDFFNGWKLKNVFYFKYFLSLSIKACNFIDCKLKKVSF